MNIETNTTQQGWECPKCKRVYSPTTHMCTYCPEHLLRLANTGTSTTYSHPFEFDKKSSSKTKCSKCGLEKWQHPNFTNT